MLKRIGNSLSKGGLALGRTWLASIAVVFASTCASFSIPPGSYAIRNPPSKEHPVRACVISCPDGIVFFRLQHICSGGKRWFKDVVLVGEYVVRGDDGVAITDAWVDAANEVYDKLDTEIGTCSQVIRSIISSRAPSERGQHPGEDPEGSPFPPRK